MGREADPGTTASKQLPGDSAVAEDPGMTTPAKAVDLDDRREHNGAAATATPPRPRRAPGPAPEDISELAIPSKYREDASAARRSGRTLYLWREDEKSIKALDTQLGQLLTLEVHYAFLQRNSATSFDLCFQTVAIGPDVTHSTPCETVTDGPKEIQGVGTLVVAFVLPKAPFSGKREASVFAINREHKQDKLRSSSVALSNELVVPISMLGKGRETKDDSSPQGQAGSWQKDYSAFLEAARSILNKKVPEALAANPGVGSFWNPSPGSVSGLIRPSEETFYYQALANKFGGATIDWRATVKKTIKQPDGRVVVEVEFVTHVPPIRGMWCFESSVAVAMPRDNPVSLAPLGTPVRVQATLGKRPVILSKGVGDSKDRIAVRLVLEQLSVTRETTSTQTASRGSS